MKLYRIANWDRQYESAQTKRLKKLGWVSVSNQLDGLGFRRIAAHAKRCELFSAWILILQVASRGKQGNRGVLIRDGKPLTAEDLAIITGFPVEVFQEALEFFSDPKQGWLEVVDVDQASGALEEILCDPQESAHNPQRSAADSMQLADNLQGSAYNCPSVGKGTVQNGTGGEGHPPPPSAELPPEIPSRAEVIAFGFSRLGNQIPEDYCSYFFEKTDNNREWLNGKGELRNWKRILPGWWEKDKHTWAVKRNRMGQPGELVQLPRAIQSNRAGGV